MYPIEASGDMAVDGIFWQLLAYCAGVGGSMLIIGSCSWRCCYGIRKDNLWLVYEENYLDSLCRLYCRYSFLLSYSFIHIQNSIVKNKRI